MVEDKQRRVEELVKTLAPALELSIARNLKQASRATSHLSLDGLLADQINRSAAGL